MLPSVEICVVRTAVTTTDVLWPFSLLRQGLEQQLMFKNNYFLAVHCFAIFGGEFALSYVITLPYINLNHVITKEKL